jgi:hypothetical protein
VQRPLGEEPENHQPGEIESLSWHVGKYYRFNNRVTTIWGGG